VVAKQVLRVVVASPGDVLAEREAIPSVIEELNQSIGEDRQARLEAARWETDAYPGFHIDGPQGLIDSVMRPGDCDVLLGIFWKRFGTPVTDALSGTEHEIRLAHEAWKSTGRPQLMIYFKQEPYTPQSRAEIEQWGRVLHFRETFPKEGLWWAYSTAAEFQNLVRRHLSNLLRTLLPIRATTGSHESCPDPRGSTPPSPSGLLIALLELSAPHYSSVIAVDFCVVNDSKRHKSLTDLSVEILGADKVSQHGITGVGAPFEPHKFDVSLDPLQQKILITPQRYMYKPNEREDFQLRLSSPPGFKYRLRITGLHHDIVQSTTATIASRSFAVEFPNREA
jgi:hypothetical protein